MHRARVRRSAAHRPLWFRALIALWGIWFTTALTEPAGLFACQMHSGMNTGHGAHATAASPDASPDASPHGPHALPMVSPGNAAIGEAALSVVDHAQMAHGAGVAATVAPNAGGTRVVSETATPPEHSCCTCIGQCATAPAAIAPFRAPEFATETISDAVRAESPERAHHPLHRAHALPFANGPPLNA